MASNSTMSPAWAIYCERLGGWLVDTSFVWSFDVSQCEEFSSKGEAMTACREMHDNGHTNINYRSNVWDRRWDVEFMRIR